MHTSSLGTLQLSVRLMKSKGNIQESQSQGYPTGQFLFPDGELKTNPAARRSQPMAFIPTTADQWMDFMVDMVRTKTCLRYLSDKELKQVIHRARKNFSRDINSGPDPDLPECYSWDEKQVADWLTDEGFPHLYECFILNRLTGRKLVAVDASALVKMGLRDFNEIKRVSSKIRELLEIPRPNMMRALIRIVPFESYLRKRLRTGKTYDLLHFENFCSQNGFPYDYLLAHSKNAEIPCTAEVSIRTLEETEECDSATSESSSDAASLKNVPTVEFFARNVLVHDKIVQDIIDQTLECIFKERKCSKECYCLDIGKTIKSLLEGSYRSLGLEDADSTGRRLDFASNVARSLISELQRTALVLTDIGETRRQLKRTVSTIAFNDMRSAVSLFIEEVLPLATLMSVGEFSLESIFRQEPDFQKFVQQVTKEAEGKIQAVLPAAEEIVNSVVADAERHANTAD